MTVHVTAVRLTPFTIENVEEMIGGDAGTCHEHPGGCLIFATTNGPLHARLGEIIESDGADGFKVRD